jgi:Pregnancy-associated plasma protein-A
MKRNTVRRLSLLAVLAAAAVAAFQVTTATAARTSLQTSWLCNSAEVSSFSSLSGLMAPGISTARGGESREPAMDQTLDTGATTRAYNPNFTATVPVWVHVITPDGTTGNVSRALINDQIVVLNNTYAGGEGGVDTGFRFTLVGVDRTVNADWYNAKPAGDERAMKRALHRGGPNTLNMYLSTASDFLGWAYLPKVVTQGNAFLDGIVIDWESLRGASDRYRGRYDQGETATHEVGHWLNLEHTFYRGCNGRGDYVDDTPYEATPTSGCPEGKDTCPAPGIDPIHNYMDYSYDQCYTEFTAGQAARMQDAWLTFRAP